MHRKRMLCLQDCSFFEKRHWYYYRIDTKTKRFEIQSSLISNNLDCKNFYKYAINLNKRSKQQRRTSTKKL